MKRTSAARMIVGALGSALVIGVLPGCLMEVEGEEDEASQLDDLQANGGREPVIFVHGCPPPIITTEIASHFFDPMMAYFKAHGYTDAELFRYVSAGPQCDSAITQAAQLAALVDQVRATTGARKVDIVAHSFGALMTRLYLSTSSCKVDDFVSIAGANHGSEIAEVGVEWQSIFGAPAFEGAKQMYPTYACLGETVDAADIQFAVNGCLTPTGRTHMVDETPGQTKYLSIRNSFDIEVVPVESSCLNQRYQNDCRDKVNVEVHVPPGPGPCTPEGCPAHITVVFDPAVMEMTRKFVK
jgi:pimeloyl-ACP methyl ester carboxylesterase